MEPASLVFQSSWKGSALSVDATINHKVVCLADHLARCDIVHSSVTRGHDDQFCLLLSSLLSGLPSVTTRAV